MHIALCSAAVAFLFPFVWIGMAAFKTQIALLIGRIVFTPVFSNFEELLFSKTSRFLENFGNSLIVGGCSTAMVLVAGGLAAYSLHRMRWPAWFSHGLLLWAAIFHMLPPITMVGAWFYMFRTVGLDNTYLGLILAHVTLNLPLAIWLLTVSVQEIPREIEEAAWVDGASTPVIIFRIILPLIAPGLMAAAILIFIFSWNEFAVAVNLTQNETQTVPVAIAKFAQEHEVKYPAMAAGSTLSLIPALLLLLIGQRFIVRGLVAGAIK
jgi:multiple sugar transport system permease protein